jgi:hypothetical protein
MKRSPRPAWIVACVFWAHLGCAGPPFAAPAAASELDLYVSPTGSDADAGTQAAPLRTILAASRRAQPGTTVHVAPGIYEGSFKTTASGTASSPVHYVSDTKWGAKIVPPPDSPSEAAWDNRGAYVVIDGFEVDGTVSLGGIRWREGIYTAGSHSIVRNNHVHNVAWDVPNDSHGGGGIMGDGYYGGTEIVIVANVVHDIGPADAGFIHGIYMATSGSAINNLEYRAGGYGIHLWHDANHVTIANNTVFNNDSGGIMIGGGNYYHTNGPADYIFVLNNIVYRNRKFGIEEHGRTGRHNFYSNNLVYENEKDWVLHNGLAAYNTVKMDPKFVNFVATGGGDYHLAADSPAIDAGTATNAPADDLDGRARPQGAAHDIGAYEFATPPITEHRRIRSDQAPNMTPSE